MSRASQRQTIVLGVTVDQSLVLLRGFPQKLASEGWEVHLVSSGGPGFEEFEGIEGLHIHRIPMERSPSPIKDVKSLIPWLRLMRDVRPDAVSLGTPKASLLGLMAAAIYRVPKRTYLLRGLRLEGETGLKASILRTVEKVTVSFSTEVLSVSDSLRKAALQLGIVRPHKIRVLGSGSSNGVNLNWFRPNTMAQQEREKYALSLGLSPGLPVVGFVGRLTRDKGIEDLISASRILREQGCEHQLLIVGNIDDDAIDESGMANFVNSSRVVVTGRVKDSQPYYQLMDVLALPTRREGLPTVALEAQSSGVPVVTTDVTGARDSILNGSTGILVPYGDAIALAAALQRLLLEPNTKAEMSVRAREFVSGHFSQGRVWELLMEYYSMDRKYSDPVPKLGRDNFPG